MREQLSKQKQPYRLRNNDFDKVISAGQEINRALYGLYLPCGGTAHASPSRSRMIQKTDQDAGEAPSGGGLHRRQVDHKPVLHIAFKHAFVSRFDLVHADHLDVGDDVVLRAKMQHLLRLFDAADQ